MRFGQILKEKREGKGYTQEEMGEKLGVSRQNVCNYETGYKLPSVRVLEAAADLFNCSTDEMLGRRCER